MAEKISNISSALSVSPHNPIILYDYDGSIIASYTKTQFIALEEYPLPPSHEDLIFDEYNWSLSEAKTYLSTHDNLYIGAIYKTVDDATILYIDVDENFNSVTISYAINGTSSIDWGDGLIPTTVTGSSESSIISSSRNLPSGIHKVKITTSDDAKIVITGGTNGTTLVDYPQDQIYPYVNRLQKIVLGNAKIGNGAFRNTYGIENIIMTNKCIWIDNTSNNFQYTKSLYHLNLPKSVTTITPSCLSNSGVTTISLPSTLTTLKDYSFNTSNVEKLSIPNSTTTFFLNALTSAQSIRICELPDSVSNLASEIFSGCRCLEKIKLPTMTSYQANYTSLFNNCESLKEVIIPEQYTAITNNMFNGCKSLLSIKLPKNINSIGSYFMDNSSLRVIDCTELIQVPSLGSTPLNVPPTYRFIVPDSLYESWIQTTNWSTISSHIIKESDL